MTNCMIIFRTKENKETLPMEHLQELYKQFWRIIQNLKGNLYAIDGVENHVHLVTTLPHTITLEDFKEEILCQSALWIKATGNYPAFESWEHEGYLAVSIGPNVQEVVQHEIKNQKEYHKRVTFEQEFRATLLLHGFEVEGCDIF